METTVMIIKPQWIQHVNEIFMMLLQAGGLRVVSGVRITLDADTALAMYPDCIDEQVKRVIVAQLTEGPSMVLVIEGDNAVRRVVELCGTGTDPANCAEGTIRRRFGTFGPVQVDGVPFYLNVVHRSRTDLEVVRDLRLFRLLFARFLSRISC